MPGMLSRVLTLAQSHLLRELGFCEVLGMPSQVLTFDSELKLLWCAKHVESGLHTCTVSSLHTKPLSD